MPARTSVTDPLNIPRPPQGHPVMCRAGQSEDGLELAARTSYLIFNNRHTAEGNRAFREDVRARTARAGRDPDKLLFMPGVFVVIGGTEAEAQAKIAAARDAVDETTAKRFLRPFLPRIELTQIDYDAAPPHTDAVCADTAAAGMVLQGNGCALTIRELCSSHGNRWRQFQLVGTPEQVADGMSEWFDLGIVDGFNLMTLAMPDGYADIADTVVPILQQRWHLPPGVRRQDAARDLGLARPERG